ncbi:hypothetical protein NPIL_475851 [Nephila pilipes]|uniref:Uncharacterized protein n=1 Tax=Nephila pilipes TaxID=299642 RepID=A0A8X6UDW8_NEPPI|nr:hypothetical protein NPIL_475851 [Nephila pilipes]
MVLFTNCVTVMPHGWICYDGRASPLFCNELCSALLGFFFAWVRVFETRSDSLAYDSCDEALYAKSRQKSKGTKLGVRMCIMSCTSITSKCNC